MSTAKDLMSKRVKTLTPKSTITDAAKELAKGDFGSMPVVAKDGSVCGVITDRDIVVKGLAKGVDLNASVCEIATTDVVTVNASDDAEAVAKTLADHKIRRVPVVEDGKLVGIVAQADIAKELGSEVTGETVEKISK